MKFKIVLLYDEKREEIGQLTEGVARAYCTRHGYEFVVYRSLWRPDLHPTYSCGESMAAEMEMNPTVDWFFRLDSDSIIVNQNIRLETLVEGAQCSMLGSADSNGLCMGTYFMRNSGWSSRLLQTISFLGDMTAERWKDYDHHNTYDQSALKCLARHFPRVSKEIALLPQNLIQNPRSTYCPEAFMMHYWSSTGLSLIATKMREVISNGWSRKGFYQWGEKLSS
jgi:hypothetical protein